MMEDRWLSVDEIAAYLGIKRDTVYKWISARQMPGRQLSLTLRNGLIGCYIGEYELRGSDRTSYGDRLLSELSKELRRHKVSNTGRRQLYNYLAFYRAYPQIVRTVPAQTRHLLPKDIDSQKVRTVSAQLAITPEKLLGSLYYERSGLSKDKKKLAELALINSLENELPKDDESLRAKGKNRWYVPAPNKADDLEKLRERSLLKEFEEYRASSQKRLKVFRLEAVRAGFKKARQESDYATIITVSRKVPENVLQENPKLLMWYDQALTRMGGE
jgi:hypothetical protein